MGKETFGIVGFPWDGGASLGRPGARFAPQGIRDAYKWFENRIENNQVYDVDKRKLYTLSENSIVDYGDIDIVAYSTEKTFENAKNKATEMLTKDVFPFVLGGDHSISYPIIEALHDNTEGKIGIIQFDAHLDLVDDSPVQGKYSQSSQMRRAIELERISPEHVVQIGVRSFNYPWYAEYLNEIGVVQYTAREVHSSDPKKIISEILNDKLKDVDHIYLTFDMDVLEPGLAPGTGANEPGGLTVVQAFSMLEELYDKVDVFDIAEVNPLYDVREITASIAAKIMFECAVSRLSKK
ncbi:agmatinase [Bacillus sp. J14TS2]|uniref:agmatinase family protein n=1 Tax=Bacillus sp. J14TS2 TaxID=2807188 RepID=UPI001B176FFE|nr:agmatinase family protein [Bacillus sp. J14TS2]GIN73932.1 agmatinase [Bacillus sp. J14TS2]